MIAADGHTSIDDALAWYFECVDRDGSVDETALLKRFPQHANELRAFFDSQNLLHAKVGRLSNGRSIQNQLSVRCPNCHQPTQVAADSTLIELKCQACGSGFSLVDSTKETTDADALRRIGRFQLIERLGMGAFGSVWKARDDSLDRMVAIKIPRQTGMSANEQEKFFREARAAAQLRHPNIVSIHEVGRDGDSIYIVSDFVRGVTLADWLTGQRPTNREAAELCCRIADALHHAHECGVIHRDLKPGNIMIDGGVQPHLMDFGLARREAGEVTMTMDGHVLGTPAYMSPEQAEGKGHAADRRSDVYSLGVILFQLLTGELPFRGNARMLMHQVIHDEPPSPRKLNGNISRDLETITLKSLEKSAERRYGTAKEVAEELRRFLRGEPITARPIGRFARAYRWGKRKPGVAALLLSLVAATIVSTWLSVWATRAESQAQLDRQSAEKSAQRAQTEKLRADEQTTVAREQSALSQKRLYASQIGLAHQAWLSGDTARTLNLLEGLRPALGEEDLRTFEWRYLWECCHQNCRHILKGHTGPIQSVAYSPDGKFLASASTDLTVRLWDAASGELVHVFHLADGTPSLAFSPNGKILAVSDWVALKLWNLPERTLRANLKTSDAHCLAFSPDGKTLATSLGNGGFVRLINVETGKPSYTFHEVAGAPLTSIVFSPDSTMFTGGFGGSLFAWSWNGKDLAKKIFRVDSLGPSGVFTPDSKMILSDCGFLIDPETRKITQKLDGPRVKTLSSVFSPDGKLVASARMDRCALLWDPATGKEIRRFPHAEPVNGVAFSPDGLSLATAGSDKVIKIWSLESHQQPLRRESPVSSGRRMTKLAFLPSGRELLIGVCNLDGPGILKWDLQSGAETVLQKSPGMAAISADGATMAFTDSKERSLKLWDAKANKERAELTKFNDIEEDLTFSPDGTRIAFCDSYGQIRLWDAKSGEPITAIDLQFGAYAICLSRNGDLLAIAGSGGIAIRDPASGKPLQSLPTSAHSLAFSADNRLLAAGRDDGVIDLFETKTWRHQKSLNGHTDSVRGLAFFHDSNTLVSGSSDGSVRFWDTDTGQERMTFRELNDRVNAVAISPDDRVVAAASPGGTTKVWWASDAPEALALRSTQTDSELHLDKTFKAVIGQYSVSGAFYNAMLFASKNGPEAIDLLIKDAVSFQGYDTPLVNDREVLCQLRTLAGSYPSAEEAIRRLIAKLSYVHRFHKTLGWCLLSQGRRDEARDAFLESLKELRRGDGSYNLEKADEDHLTAAYFLDLITEGAYIDRLASKDRFACVPWFYVGQRREMEKNTVAAIHAYTKCAEVGAGCESWHATNVLAEWRLEKLTGK